MPLVKQRIRAGALVGCLVAAAVAGALVGFGARGGDPARHVNATARPLLGSRVDFVTGLHPLVTSAGVLLLLAGSVAWAILFALVAAPLRGMRLLLAALVVSALAFCTNAFVLPPLMGGAPVAGLTLPRLALVHALVALVLAPGMRLALSWFRLDQR